MIGDLQLTVGDICGDPTGLQVRVDSIDTFNRVHFSVIEDSVENWILRGEMSHDTFVGRFMKLNHSETKTA
jgi:hypothetical protein